MNKNIIVTALIFIITGIIFGAFGAHSLKEIVSETKISSFEVGVRYEIYQGLGLLIIGCMYDKFNFNPIWVYRLGYIGTILFSGSIYLLTLNENIELPTKILGPITPLGGSLIIFSWLLLLYNVSMYQKNNKS